MIVVHIFLDRLINSIGGGGGSASENCSSGRLRSSNTSAKWLLCTIKIVNVESFARVGGKYGSAICGFIGYIVGLSVVFWLKR